MSGFKNLEITGDISVEPIPEITKGPYPYRILIMGPTGAGKSSFIEALAAQSQKMSISKDQLDGYTQEVTAYHLLNVKVNGYPVYLIDTPGFSDTDLSEMEIMGMIRNWVSNKGRTFVDRVLYLIPITETRLVGSKRRTIDMLKTFVDGAHHINSIIFVTTMWDTLHTDRTRQRAESNFAQLRDDILKGILDQDADIAQFRNTKHSALQILNMYKEISYTHIFTADLSSSSQHLYQELHERIEGALQQRRFFESELAQMDIQNNPELKSLLEKNRNKIDQILIKFIGQLASISEVPKECKHAAQGLRKRIATEFTLLNPHQAQILHSRAPEPEITEQSDTPSEITESVALSHSPSTDRPAGTVRPRPTRMLALKGILRRLIKLAKRRGNKWFKRRA